MKEDAEPKAVMSLGQCHQLLRELQELRLRLEALKHSVAAYVTDVEEATG